MPGRTIGETAQDGLSGPHGRARGTMGTPATSGIGLRRFASHPPQNSPDFAGRKSRVHCGTGEVRLS
jgi:hypothetical protein